MPRRSTDGAKLQSYQVGGIDDFLGEFWTGEAGMTSDPVSNTIKRILPFETKACPHCHGVPVLREFREPQFEHGFKLECERHPEIPVGCSESTLEKVLIEWNDDEWWVYMGVPEDMVRSRGLARMSEK